MFYSDPRQLVAVDKLWPLAVVLYHLNYLHRLTYARRIVRLYQPSNFCAITRSLSSVLTSTRLLWNGKSFLR